MYFYVLCGSRIKLQNRDKMFYYESNDLVKCHVFNFNLLIVFGKCYIHKCKWSERKPNIHQLKSDIKLYFETLKGLTNKKAIQTLKIYNALQPL